MAKTEENLIQNAEELNKEIDSLDYARLPDQRQLFFSCNDN
jgi:hypothetical protein